MKDKVAILIPAYDWKMHTRTAFGLIELGNKLQTLGIGYYLRMVEGHCYIDNVRNSLVHAALQTDATKFLFIDTDIEFRAHDALWVLDAPEDKKVVCGIYRTKKDDMQAACRTLLPPDAPMVDKYYRELDAAPTGFMMIHRDVLEDPKVIEQSPEYCAGSFDGEPFLRRYFEITYEPMPEKGNAPTFTGEDVMFTRKCMRAGYQVWGDMRPQLGHWGKKVYKFEMEKIDG